MRFRLLALFALFAACSTSLPSAEPLGTGPLAERGDAAAVAKTSSDAAAPGVATASKSPSPAPKPTVAVTPGDGGPDAAPAATAKTEEKDAGAKPASTAAIDGEYAGWDTTTYRIANAPPTERDPNARTRVVKGAGDNVEIVIINSSNGQDLCRLKGKLKGSDVTLEKGQRCFEENNVTASLKKGSAKFSGKQLVVDAEFEIRIDTGEDRLSGEIVYHFEGTRK